MLKLNDESSWLSKSLSTIYSISYDKKLRYIYDKNQIDKSTLSRHRLNINNNCVNYAKRFDVDHHNNTLITRMREYTSNG